MLSLESFKPRREVIAHGLALDGCATLPHDVIDYAFDNAASFLPSDVASSSLVLDALELRADTLRFLLVLGESGFALPNAIPVRVKAHPIALSRKFVNALP